MKVLVLGGAGGMGEIVVREAVRFSFVESVTVADLHAAHAAEVAGRYPGKASAIRLDINDRAAMQAAIGAHDVVLNAVGPFYTHGLTVLEQVIDAGRNYADICDDWEPTLDMLALSHRAQERGVTAVIGIGASPGVTNMIALKAARALDEVDELLTCWSIAGSDQDAEVMRSQRPRATGASAALIHWVQQLTGTIRVLADGGFQDVKPLTSRTIRYPGRGDVVIWSVGHPEAVTLPRAIPGLLHCANAMAGPPESFEGLAVIASLVDNGTLTVHQAADAILESMHDSAAAHAADAKPAYDDAPPLFAWARGRRNDRPAIAAAEVHSMPSGGMAGATSVPFSLVLQYFAETSAIRPGVFAPEEIIDPDDFLNRLAPLCIGDFQSAEDLVTVSCEEQAA
jgi:saccharopine dehydrogenase-like NADP-dependent oxidoreductase